MDIEDLVQLGDLEDLVYLRIDVTQDQAAACRLQLLVERDQLAQGRAGQVLDVAEVQEDLLAARFIDQAKELFADQLDVLLIEDLAVGEIHDRDVPDVFD